jgi:hypothetical protein
MSLFSIFRKKTKQVKESVPTFNIKETEYRKVDFEITEISYEEYLDFPSQERRGKVRQPKGR